MISMRRKITIFARIKYINSMKLFTTDRFTTEEHQQFLTAYRKLLELVPSRIATREWRLIRKYILRGVEVGIYDRNAHGVQQLVHLIMTCQVLHEQVGLGRRSILTVLLYPLAEHDVISREEVTKDFGEEVAHLMSCMGKVKHLYAEHDNLEDENFRNLVDFCRTRFEKPEHLLGFMTATWVRMIPEFHKYNLDAIDQVGEVIARG